MKDFHTLDLGSGLEPLDDGTFGRGAGIAFGRHHECLVIGGGFSGNRLGELAVARAGLLLKAEDIPVELELIRNDPDEAGLLGAAHLLPAWMLKGYDGILAVDVGGSNIRAGIVELNISKNADLSKARVVHFELWRHSDDEDVKRDDAVERLAEMLNGLLDWAKRNKLWLTRSAWRRTS